MSFFMNVFDFEFRANLMTADRRYDSMYKIPASTNRSDYLLSGKNGPYDLSSDSNLTISYAYDPQLLGYVELTIDIAGADVSATKVSEIVNILNSNSSFAELFIAYPYNNQNYDKVLIRSKKDKSGFRAYILNTGAEVALKFNRNAPVTELPSYFERYAIENRFVYPNLGTDRLILLDPMNPIDSDIIVAAGLDPLNPTPDWKLLKGNNDAFWFYNRAYVDGKLATEIKYPAGASAGDLAKKTYYTYDGSDLVGVMETPYVLTGSDLITP